MLKVDFCLSPATTQSQNSWLSACTCIPALTAGALTAKVTVMVNFTPGMAQVWWKTLTTLETHAELHEQSTQGALSHLCHLPDAAGLCAQVSSLSNLCVPEVTLT